MHANIKYLIGNLLLLMTLTAQADSVEGAPTKGVDLSKPESAETLGKSPAGCAQSTPQTPSRYIVKADEVYDRKTDLTWQRCSVGQRWGAENGCVGIIKTFSFDEAQKQAKGVWRLPAIEELETLIVHEKKIRKEEIQIEVSVFPDMDYEKLWYWSGSPSDQQDLYWGVGFGNDMVENGANNVINRLKGAVRLVHSGR